MLRFAWILALVVPTAAAAVEKSAVAVLDIQGTGVEASLLPTLTEVLTVEIDNLGMYKVIAGRDVQAMLGFEKDKDMVGCTDAACLAEIGGALGVDRIVASHIGKVGSTYVVNIKLINIRMADTEARVYETVRGEVDALILTMRKSVAKLLGSDSTAAVALAGAPTSAKPRPKATPAEPQVEPAPAPAPAPQQVAQAHLEPSPGVAATAESGGIGWLPISLWSAGGACIAVGVLFAFDAHNKEQVANERAPESTEANPVYVAGAQVAADQAQASALLANILWGVGGAAVAGGVLTWLLGGSGGNAPAGATAVAPVVGPGHVGMSLSGQF